MVLPLTPPANDPPPSSWELVNRAEKARALIQYLDEYVARAGYSPYSDAAAVLRVLEATTDDGWKAFAAIVGVNVPSSATRALVKSAYHERVRLLARGR